MHWTIRTVLCCTMTCFAPSFSTMTLAQTNPFSKAQVADRIRKVEDGVDEFQKYLENRGESARSRAQSAQSDGTSTRRRQGSSSNTQARQGQAQQTKDELDSAMDDLNQS